MAALLQLPPHARWRAQLVMRFLRKLHKWLGLVIGLQVILWAVSGVMFAWLNHADVEASGSVRTNEPPVLAPAAVKAEPAVWLADYAGQDLFDVRVVSVADRWAWRVELQDRAELRSIQDGTPLQLDESWVRQLALDRYAGAGRLVTTSLQTTPDIESRAQSPVWRAQFDDPQRTALYFAADDGHFITARSATWRLYDFFWMLHTMDYIGRDNFNNPLIIIIGFATLWLSISGAVLLTRSFR